uniref:Uncharacterized protein n=1 Tax=Glossina austeni TaxID=7395 RepID=A0A1A9UY85_GLOAU
MSKIYSTHPVLASEQLQRTERGANSLAHSQPHHQHRRHNSISGRVCNKSLAKTASITDLINSSAQQQDAVTLSEQHGNVEVRNLDEVDAEETRRRRLPVASRLRNNTKDCIDSRNTTLASVDEDDHLQHRFSRTSHATQKAVDNPFSGSVGDVSCISDLSSALTSPSASTVSSPLSTPTRITSHFHHQPRTQQVVVVQSCCQTSNTLAANTSKTLNSSSVNSSTTVLNTSTAKKQPLEQQQHHLHEIHHQLQHQSQTNTNTNALTPTPLPSLPSLTNGSKNLKKFDPRLGPSPYRQLLPIALCILLFATVFSILIVYMDTTDKFFIFPAHDVEIIEEDLTNLALSSFKANGPRGLERQRSLARAEQILYCKQCPKVARGCHLSVTAI